MREGEGSTEEEQVQGEETKGRRWDEEEDEAKGELYEEEESEDDGLGKGVHGQSEGN